jgi:hypothetical protein
MAADDTVDVVTRDSLVYMIVVPGTERQVATSAVRGGRHGADVVVLESFKEGREGKTIASGCTGA